MSPGVTIRVFVSLKWTLTRNGMRNARGRVTSLVVSWVLAGLLGLFLMVNFAMLHIASDGWAMTVPLVMVIAVSWAMMPLLFPSVGDETIDVSRLALLPLRPSQLVSGLLAASFVAIGPLFGLLLLIGLAIGTAHHPASALVAMIAIPITLITFLVFSRAMATANIAMLTSRRGRERAIVGAIGLALLWELFVNVGFKKIGTVSLKELEPVGRVLEWVPPGSAFGAIHAADHGAFVLATGQMLLATAAPVAGLWWWHRSLDRVLTTGDASTIDAARPSGRSTFGRRLVPDGALGAVTLRALRGFRREPKLKAGLASSFTLGAIPILIYSREHHNMYIVFLATTVIGLQFGNTLGYDRSSFWIVLQTTRSYGDAHRELFGRLLARAILAVPYLLSLTIVVAALSGRWRELPSAIGLMLAVVTVTLAVVTVFSVCFPYSVPDGLIRGVAPGQAGIAYLGMLATLFTSALLVVPVIAVSVWLHTFHESATSWLLIPIGGAYGMLVIAITLRLVTPVFLRRLPDILHEVSKTF